VSGVSDAVECSVGRVELAVDFALTTGHPAYEDSGPATRDVVAGWGERSVLDGAGRRGDLEEIMVDGLRGDITNLRVTWSP
jgi:hypothetical protein